jgi:hypothetical protein
MREAEHIFDPGPEFFENDGSLHWERLDEDLPLANLETWRGTREDFQVYVDRGWSLAVVDSQNAKRRHAEAQAAGIDTMIVDIVDVSDF